MFTIEERIGVDRARLRGLRYDAVRADFIRRFRKSCPTNETIRQLVNKFNRTGEFMMTLVQAGHLYLKAQCNGFRKLSNKALVHRLGVSVVSLSFHNPLYGRFYTSRCINMRIMCKSCTILRLKIITTHVGTAFSRFNAARFLCVGLHRHLCIKPRFQILQI